jgi:hypothetical protein
MTKCRKVSLKLVVKNQNETQNIHGKESKPAFKHVNRSILPELFQKKKYLWWMLTTPSVSKSLSLLTF